MQEGDSHRVDRVAGPEDAARRAVLPANQALDRSYEEFRRHRDTAVPEHAGAWVTNEGGHVIGDAARGYTVHWLHPAPAGFECEALVSISPTGEIEVVKAWATYSLD